MAQKISKSFSHIGGNIRKIREVKKISQAHFAKLFNLARPSVGAYEEGRSEPKIDTIIQIAKYFRISIDALLMRKLTVSEIYSFDLLNKKLDKAHQIKNPLDGIGSKVPYISISGYLDYIVHFDSNDYLARLPIVHVPVRSKGEFRAIEMNGTEMEHQQQGLHHGDILIGKKVTWANLKSKKNEIVSVVSKENVTTRRIEGFNPGMLSLAADNSNYPLIDIPKSDVLECWIIEGIYSNKLDPPTKLEERMMRIEEELKKLKT